jgi:hypothetical protein
LNWTNRFNLPLPLASAIQFSDYDRVGDISVTGLIESPRMRELARRHDAEITEDVSEGIWRLIGSVGHKILERANTHNHLAEERLTRRILGWTVSGKPDLLGPEMVLDDYKFVSVYALLLGAKQEWEQQVAGLYPWLYRHNGFDVAHSRIVAILRDWAKTRAAREPDYPQVGVMVREYKVWPAEEQEAFAAKRVLLHQAAAKLADDDLPECTPEERWQRPDMWAVKKSANKKAYRVFDNEAAALALAEEKKEMAVEFRRGASVRCQSYCRVAQFCSWWHHNKPAVPVATDEAA